MRTRLAFFASSLLLSLAAAGCQQTRMCSEADAAPAAAEAAVPNAGAAAPSDASRAIAEADIVELGETRLYAMSASGSLAIVDLTNPDQLTLLGSASLPGRPFEMYERGNVLLAMSNGARDAAGQPVPVDPTYAAETNDASNGGASLLALDVSDPAHVRTLATFDVPGEIADSRIVGNVLYLVTYRNGACYGCGTSASTVVTTFDVSDPTNVAQVDQAELVSGAPDQYDLAWGMAWKRSILATTERLYLGGMAYVKDTSGGDTEDQGVIDVLDIRDPAGHLAMAAHLAVPGAITSRWQMDESNGVFRVVSQPGAGFTGNGTAMPVVETFQLKDATTFVPLGHATLTLPRQEGLRTVHFDGSRAYAITFNQTDPLFVIDLSDPAAPKQRGQLEMPGWMFHLQPEGDRVLGLGIDRTDPNGSLNVSLFDVSDMDSPKLVQRVAFGASDIGEDFQIIDYELPEDQDRIQKAFRVFDDGTVAVPFSSTSGYSTAACSNPASGVQLMHWSEDSLAKDRLLPITGNPRRAIERSGRMIAVSDSHVATFPMTDASATPTSDVTIGTCVDRSTQAGGGGDFVGPVDDAPMGSGPTFWGGGCE